MKNVANNTITNTRVTRTKHVFTFDELNARAQLNAIDTMRKHRYEMLDPMLIEYGLREYMIDALTNLENYVADDEVWKRTFCAEPEIAFSLSHTQGDGVAIYGTIYRDEAPLLTWADGVETIKLRRNSNFYTHYNTFDIDYFDREGEEIASSHPNTAMVRVDSYAFTSDDEKMTPDEYKLWQQVIVMDRQLRSLCRNMEREGYSIIDDYMSTGTITDLMYSLTPPRRYDMGGDLVDPIWWDEEVPNEDNAKEPHL